MAVDLFDLTGQTALVTGSASGIGSAIARLLAQAGADIVVHGFDQAQASGALVEEIKAMGRRAIAVDGDLTDTAKVASLADTIGTQMGGLSILVNCAGGSPRKAMFATMEESAWDHVIDKNLKSMFLTTQAMLPLLKAQPDASIVNVTSCVTRSGGVPGGGAYATAKGGVDVLTRALAKELAADGIRVNGVAPGLVDSPFHDSDPKAKYPHLIGRIPLGRIGEPEDIAGPVLFLVSKAARYVTAEIIEVSGGTRLT